MITEKQIETFLDTVNLSNSKQIDSIYIDYGNNRLPEPLRFELIEGEDYTISFCLKFSWQLEAWRLMFLGVKGNLTEEEALKLILPEVQTILSQEKKQEVYLLFNSSESEHDTQKVFRDTIENAWTKDDQGDPIQDRETETELLGDLKKIVIADRSIELDTIEVLI